MKSTCTCFPLTVFWNILSLNIRIITDSGKNKLIIADKGSGCGSVGRAVASHTRGPRVRIQLSAKIYVLNIYLLSAVLERLK